MKAGDRVQIRRKKDVRFRGTVVEYVSTDDCIANPESFILIDVDGLGPRSFRRGCLPYSDNVWWPQARTLKAELGYAYIEPEERGA